MPKKSRKKKNKETLLECQKAWKWLKALPEYKKDYKKYSSASKISKKEEKLIISKWGFYPLEDPESKDPSFEFWMDVTSFLDKYFDLHERSVRLTTPLLGLEMFSIDSTGALYDPNNEKIDTLGPLPETFPLKIDLRKPTGTLQKEFASIIKHIKKIYKISSKRPGPSSADKYKIFVLKNLGGGDSAIKKILANQDPSQPWDISQEDIRKKAERAFKKTLDA